jgi:hypothetical protein
MDTGNADDEQRAQLLHRFQLEAQAASLIDHPGVVDVIDMGETDAGEPFIVMEFLEGATLKAAQKQLGRLTLGQVVSVLAPALEALEAAHAVQVVHRDIKPANIFLCTRPKKVVKVLDFGISRFGEGTGMTQTGTAMGTPQYMAPEQVRGEKQVGPEADLYSVGAVIYALLSGRPPFDSENDMAVLARVMTEEHTPLIDVVPDVPPKLSALVDQLLVKDQAKRPKSAAKLRDALLALAAPDDAGLWTAAASAVRAELSKGTPRPGSRSGSRPGVLAMKGTGSRSGVKSRTGAPPGETKVARPTTGSPEAPPTRSSPALVVGALVALVAVGGAGAWFVLSQGTPTTTKAPVKPVAVLPVKQAAVVEPVKPTAPTTVEVKLTAEPAEARFFVDGVKQADNPHVVRGEVGASMKVRVEAEHYVSNEFALVLDESRERPVTLVPEAKKPTPTGTGTVKKPKGTLSVDESNPYR